MSKKSPFVPDSDWRESMEAIYRDALEAEGITLQGITIHASGDATITVSAEATELLDNLETLIPLGEWSSTTGNVRVLLEEAEQYAAENDPFANRGKSAKKESRTLSPEERAKRERRARIRQRLQERLEAWKQKADERDESDDFEDFDDDDSDDA